MSRIERWGRPAMKVGRIAERRAEMRMLMNE